MGVEFDAYFKVLKKQNKTNSTVHVYRSSVLYSGLQMYYLVVFTKLLHIYGGSEENKASEVLFLFSYWEKTSLTWGEKKHNWSPTVGLTVMEQ